VPRNCTDNGKGQGTRFTVKRRKSQTNLDDHKPSDRMDGHGFLQRDWVRRRLTRQTSVRHKQHQVELMRPYFGSTTTRCRFNYHRYDWEPFFGERRGGEEC
jgi:hypothetical protein